MQKQTQSITHIQEFLHYLQNQIIPVDLVDVFQQAGVPFFEGCLMVEVHDHREPPVDTSHNANAYGPDGRRLRPNNTSLFYLREGGRYGFHPHRLGGGRSNLWKDEAYPSPDGVEVYRMILRSSDESLWNDLRMMDVKTGGIWNDDDAMRIESQILHLTAPPLCLDPDPHVTRIANVMLSSTMPSSSYTSGIPFQQYKIDASTGYKLNSIEVEQAESKGARRLYIMNMMKNGWRSGSDSQQDLSSEPYTFVPRYASIAILVHLSSD